MADLAPLIKLRKHLVDEKRRIISQLYREAEKINQQKQIIERQTETEIALAAKENNPTANEYLGRYLQGARKKIKALESSLKKLDERIAAAQEDMRAAFAELKKIEIVRDRRVAEEKAEEKRKDDLEMDEIALTQFRRQSEE